MSGDQKSFWERPQGAATFKHAVLNRYVPVFASKVGRFSPSHKVADQRRLRGAGLVRGRKPRIACLDGKDGRNVGEEPPCRVLVCRGGPSELRNAESWTWKDPSQGPPPWPPYGTMSEHLPAILAANEGVPMFAFIDPFGLGLPFAQSTDDLMGRGRRRVGGNWIGPGTEVLVNFVHAGIYRNEGMLSIETKNAAQLKAASAKVGDLDANLGGDWWREIQRTVTSTEEAVRLIRDGYVKNVF